MHGQNLFLFWRDKRGIFMAFNAHASEMLTLPSKVPGQLDRKKPKVVNDYNQAMGGVDKPDQLGVYYWFQHNSFKWWKKVFFWLLEVAVVNSYLLHKETISSPLSHFGFRRSLIKSLVSTIGFAARPRPGRHRYHDSVERLQLRKHFLSTGKRTGEVVSDISPSTTAAHAVTIPPPP